MPLDLGRITHLLEQMHRSEDDAGDPIPVGKVLVTDGAAGFTWEDAGGAGSLQWFNAMSYGAVNDGTTDDTSAINDAIADLNTAGEGVLYFPAGAGYEVTGPLTTITASGLVMGDGMGAYDGSAYASAVLQTSATADTFVVTAKSVLFRDIGIFNVNGGTPSNGSAIEVSGSFIGQKVDLLNVVLSGFYINIDRQVGSQWSNVNVWNWKAVSIGEKIQNTVNQDAGDWSITNCQYYANTHSGGTAIKVVGAGGGKIANTKINGNGGATFADGILIALPTGVATSVFTIVGCSFENVSGDAIEVTTTGTAKAGLISITGNQFGLYSNNTGRCVKLTAAATGGITTNGGIGDVVIDGLTARTDGTARAAIELTNTDKVTLGDFSLDGFNVRYTSSGDTNTIDGASFTLTVSDEGTPLATAATSLDFVGAGVVASGTGAAKTITISGSSVTAADLEAHGVIGPLVIIDSPSTPIIFGDIVQTEAEDDLVYADLYD
jgi:hypothetical protein